MKYFKNIFKKNKKEFSASLLNIGGSSTLENILSRNYDVYKSYAFSCINARAENISKAKIFLFESRGNEKSEVKDHPFLEIINNPNKRGQTFKEILHKISTSLDLYGNAYLYIKRNYKGEPLSFYHLPSKNVRIRMNQSGTEIEEYEFFSGKTLERYPKDDIIHFLIPDPDNSFTGKALVSGFNYTQEIDYLQNLFQRNFYRNDAALGLVFESEQELDEVTYDRLMNMIQSKYEGAEFAGRTLILEGGLKVKPYKSNPKDVEILPSRKMIRDEILAMFRVPKIILGISEDVNRANARESMKIFNDYVIKPFAKICIESKFNIFLRNNFPDEKLAITMEYEFEIDRDLQLKSLDIYSKYNIASRDEIRELEGFSNDKAKNNLTKN